MTETKAYCHNVETCAELDDIIQSGLAVYQAQGGLAVIVDHSIDDSEEDTQLLADITGIDAENIPLGLIQFYK